MSIFNRFFFFPLSLLILLTAVDIRAQSAGNLHISFLDVGQGDAAILHQPGSCSVLIDAGPLLNGHKVTAALQARNISKLDMVIITHPHLDHFGGLFDIIPRIPVSQFYDNGDENQAWEYFDDYQAIRGQLNYQKLHRGDTLQCGDIRISVLHPDTLIRSGEDLNADSLVLMIEYLEFRLLHMGDLAGSAARSFTEQSNEIQADVLKVAHHGAVDAAPTALLEKVRPAHAVISTGTADRISSPSDEVLKRLEDSGIIHFRTDRDGTITVAADKAGYRVTSP